MSEELRRDRAFRNVVIALLILCVIALGMEVYFQRLDHQELFQIKQRLKSVHEPVRGAQDSPIEVAGGSIHALARDASSDGSSWTVDGSDSDLYSAVAAGGNGSVTVHGLVDANGNPIGDAKNNDLLLTNTGGWEILMYATDKASQSSKPRLVLCSALNAAGPPDQCDWSNLGDNETVYVQATSDGHFEKYKPDELHFHDKTSNCDSDDNESPCDAISSIQIYTHTELPTGPYSCKDEKDCCAVLDKPNITKCYQ